MFQRPVYGLLRDSTFMDFFGTLTCDHDPALGWSAFPTVAMSVPRTKRRFQVLLINPLQDADKGRVSQRIRSWNPPNSLACLYALALDAAERQVLGPDVAIDITAVDETSTRVRAKEIIGLFRRHQGFGMVGLVGVRSNQFPRALEIARPLRGVGLPVVIGGFVCDRLALLPDTLTDLKQALDMGCSMFVGTAENGRIDVVIRDAANGSLQSTYNDVPALPALESAPSPYVPTEALRRTIDHYASFDAHHGCPFQCSFCISSRVERSKLRRSLADDFEQSIRAHFQNSVPWFFITEENFVRSEDWEEVFNRIILLRERDKVELNIAMQIDAVCHETPNFVANAARAGVRKVFIGLENIGLTNLSVTRERQADSEEIRHLILAWKRADVITYAGKILSSTTDVPDFFCYAAASLRIRRAKRLRSPAPALALDVRRPLSYSPTGRR